jgi:hypothetical protein
MMSARIVASTTAPPRSWSSSARATPATLVPRRRCSRRRPQPPSETKLRIMAIIASPGVVRRQSSGTCDALYALDSDQVANQQLAIAVCSPEGGESKPWMLT